MANGYALEARPVRDAVRVLLDARSVATRTAGTNTSQPSAVSHHAETVAVVRRHRDGGAPRPDRRRRYAALVNILEIKVAADEL